MKHIEEIVKDRNVAKAVMQAENPKQAYDILALHGLQCDYETFIKTIEDMKNVYEKQQAGLLTEADMDNLLAEGTSTEAVGTIFLFLIPFAV